MVAKARKKVERVEYVETEILQVPLSEGECTSLKELRELVRATEHLSDETVVTVGWSGDDRYEYSISVDPTETWTKLVAEWQASGATETTDAEEDILNNIGVALPKEDTPVLDRSSW